MALYAIGDTHLSFGVNKPMDVFQGWNDYTRRLEQNWKKLLCDDDTVVIAGDISWAMNLKDALPDFQFLHRLPGQKILLKGNHDYWWETRRKLENFFAEHELHDFKIIFNSCETVGEVAVCGTRSWFFDAEADTDQLVLKREIGRLKTSIAAAKETGKEPIVFLHYPPLTTTRICQEIIDVLKEEHIKRCYYGHLHGHAIGTAWNGEYEGIQFRLISADHVKFCPYLVQP